MAMAMREQMQEKRELSRGKKFVLLVFLCFFLFSFFSLGQRGG
jgi:hypothetical protein